MDAEAFAEQTGVSRETLARLEIYAGLIRRWQPRINLVGPATLRDLWRRHFLDSAQLLPLLPPFAKRLVDVGSGAGFPGLVLAILGVEDVHLIERDVRKAVFLREVVRLTRATATVHATDVEKMRLDPPADVITARAFAPLASLVNIARPLAGPETVGLFLKGRTVATEIEGLPAGLVVDLVPSRTDSEGAVVRVRGLDRG